MAEPRSVVSDLYNIGTKGLDAEEDYRSRIPELKKLKQGYYEEFRRATEDSHQSRLNRQQAVEHQD